MDTIKKLQIILITYNRCRFAKETLDTFLDKSSPVKDYDLLVLDNNSTDGTKEMVEAFQSTHPNVRYLKNKYNLGISGNIARAMELAEKDYVWIIGDDDVFDFSNWAEVEEAIQSGRKLIACSRYLLTKETENDVAWQALQVTFITGGIYKTSIFNDRTMFDAFANIYTLFPHMVPVFHEINAGETFYVVKKSISSNGRTRIKKDYSFVRGIGDSVSLSPRIYTQDWCMGYAGVCSIIKDRKLREHVYAVGLDHNGDHIKGFLAHLIGFRSRRLVFQLWDVYSVAPRILAFLIRLCLLPGMIIPLRIANFCGYKIIALKRFIRGEKKGEEF